MNKIKRRTVAITAGLFLSLSAMCGVLSANKKAESAEASVGNYSTDASTYYNDITATSGKQLAAQLHNLITSTHRTYTTYDDNGKNLYQQKTDQYYENGSKVNGYIYEFYSGVKWPNAWSANSGSTTGGYNREHCWCQSLSDDLWGTTGGGSDMHHLRPVEVRLNSTRGNNLYGEISSRDSHKAYAKFGSNETYAHGGYNSGGVFEPLDSKKGDVARIILYPYIHYNSYKGSDLFGSYGTTNGSGDTSYFKSSLLPLTNVIKTSAGTEAKALELMLKWNSDDPVDDIERRRNEQVAVYQGNRNPFIDNSSYADAIWGTAGITSISKTTATLTNGNTTTISAISSNGGTISWSTSNSNICAISSSTAASGSNITLTAGNTTGTATITASITISGNTYSKTCSVTVEAPKTLSSIAVSDQKTSLKKDSAFEFGGTVTATYTDTTTKDVTLSATYSGYNMSVADTYTVTVSYTENGTTKTATYSLTVAESSGSGSVDEDYTYGNQGTGTGKTWSLTNCDDQSSYWLCPSSGTTSVALIPGIFTDKTITSDVVITITSGTYGNGTNPSSSTFAIYNSSACTSQVTATQTGTLPTSKTYTDAVYTVSLANSTNFTDDLAIKVTKPGKQIRLFSINVQFDYEISGGSSEPTLSSITLDTTDVQTTFLVGDTFNYDGLIVVAHYSDSSTEDLDSFDVSSPNMTTTGNKTVTVTYSEKSATYTIIVTAAPSSISASVDKTFYVGETISKSDISVEDNLGNEITGFSFSSYQFKYADASSGGSLTNKTFTNAITYSTFTCSLTVQVQRKAYTPIAPVTWNKVTDASTLNVGDVIILADSGNNLALSTEQRTSNRGTAAITKSNNQITWSNELTYEPQHLTLRSTSGIDSAPSGSFGLDTGNGYLYAASSSANQLKTQVTNNINGAFVITITNGVATVSATGSNNRPLIRSNFGNNPSIFNCYAADSSTGNLLEVYKKTGGEAQSATNVSNYIMYEDTNAQCTTKFGIAKGYFEDLSTSERSTFMTSDDYVISTARTRLEAWARYHGKVITTSDGDYVITDARNPVLNIVLNSNNNTILIVIVVTTLSLLSIGGYFFLKKKKEI